MLQVLFDESAYAPDLLHLLDRDDPRDVLVQMTSALSKVAAGEQSLLVHASGTRALSAAEPLPTVSTALIGAAVSAGVDIVPLAFHGGLPLNGVAQRLEFPVGYGQQQFVVGPRIRSSELQGLSAVQQRARVLEALNPMLTDAQLDQPGTADPAFTDDVAQWVAQHGVDPVQAVLWQSLNQSALPLSKQAKRLITLAKASGKRTTKQPDDPWLRAVSETVFGR